MDTNTQTEITMPIYKMKIFLEEVVPRNRKSSLYCEHHKIKRILTIVASLSYLII